MRQSGIDDTRRNRSGTILASEKIIGMGRNGIAHNPMGVRFGVRVNSRATPVGQTAWLRTSTASPLSDVRGHAEGALLWDRKAG